MAFNAPTNVGKHVTSNIACARSQWYTKNSVFLLAQMTLALWRYVISHLFLDRKSCLLVGPSKITLCMTKGGILHKGITYNIIWANQKTESHVYRWLHSLANFKVTFQHLSEHRKSFQAFCQYNKWNVDT